MAIIMPSKDGFNAKTLYNGQLFQSPKPANRKITAGFTYLQRIAKNATFDVWFPEELKEALCDRQKAGLEIGSAQFPAHWAAVRQFELLHESGNHKIYDLDPDNLKRCFQDLSKSMRAGGYRITVATLGSYAETSSGDELEILDRSLQERIAQMIHMLYLNEQSAEANEEADAKLAAEKWDFRHELPHVGMMLGAESLFQPEKSQKQAHQQARQFFEILDTLPQCHIVHDTAIGLQIPESNANNEWNYIADPQETLGAFNRVINDVFGKLSHLSLGRLQGSISSMDAPTAIYHLRGYGDRLTQETMAFQRSAAQYALG